MSSNLKWFALLLILLAGCAAPSSTPQPTLVVWRVQRTPSLGWMDDAVNQCIREQAQAGVFLEEVAIAGIDPLQADITLTWGTVPEGDLPVYQLGSDSLAVIVHPDNPLQAVTADQFSSIASGKWTTWKQVDEILDGEIAWWVLLPEDETRLLLANILGADLQANPYAWLAPDPAAVVSSVAEDPLAIGAVPSRWVNASVKTILLEGIGLDKLALPILAVMREQPGSELTAFIGCLQKSFTK